MLDKRLPPLKFLSQAAVGTTDCELLPAARVVGSDVMHRERRSVSRAGYSLAVKNPASEVYPLSLGQPSRFRPLPLRLAWPRMHRRRLPKAANEIATSILRVVEGLVCCLQ
jgi:hypothetical protein